MPLYDGPILLLGHTCIHPPPPHTHTVYPPSSLNINSTEIFMANMVTVILEWKEEAGVSYIAEIFPATQIPLTLTENTRLQLELSYNTVYNVTITATLCGQNSVNTSISLTYRKLHHHDSSMYQLISECS